MDEPAQDIGCIRGLQPLGEGGLDPGGRCVGGNAHGRHHDQGGEGDQDTTSHRFLLRVNGQVLSGGIRRPRARFLFDLR